MKALSQALLLISLLVCFSLWKQAYGFDQPLPEDHTNNGGVDDPHAEGVTDSPSSSCCGKSQRFLWMRYVGGVMVDSDWIIGVPGRTIYNVYNKGSHVVKVAVSMPPYAEGAEPPKLSDGVRYYDGRFPGVGKIVAEQVDKWETWRFTYAGYEIVDGEGFIAGQTYNIHARSELKGQWSQDWDLSFKDGGWVSLTSSNNDADLLYGPPGSQLEEIEPDLQGLGWTEVKLPNGLGYFFGRSHAIGEVWTVTVNGQSSTVKVTAKDPLAIGLLD